MVLLVVFSVNVSPQPITNNVCTLAKSSLNFEDLQSEYRSLTGGVNHTNLPDPNHNNTLHQSSLCGQTVEDQSEKIITGQETPASAWPWFVYLKTYLPSGIHLICGGSILTELWILTAAHCAIELDSVVIVYFGMHDIRQKQTVKHITSRKFLSKAYRLPNGLLENDIMLIKLDSPITFTESIRPICLPTKDMTNSTNCFSIGFGRTREKGPGSTKLLQIKSNPMNQKLCMFLLRYTMMSSVDTLICGDDEHGQGVCMGDSGGPLSCKEDGRYYIVGVISAGFDCGMKELPNIMVSVYAWLDWIKTTIKAN
ncbi:plasma kallikrein-like [Physella acuta]|uniref:plasma kallikrein-like n=1 Tax=Physella acuta TaxID=109671 RepID=UPI0027DDD7BE|nr:plasma kallikrein-like [Physella acuta]